MSDLIVTRAIKLSRVQDGTRYGISRGNGHGVYFLSPGIADPLCGWDWLLGRQHPEVENIIEVTAYGCHFKASINPEAHKGNIVKEWARAALAGA
jgi:hypothetical protein